MRQDPTGFQATPLLDHLVAKVLAGEATPDEVATVNQQLALPVSDRSGTLSLDQVTNSLHTLPVPPRFDAHMLWHRLQTRLATREARPLSRGERFKAQPLRMGASKIQPPRWQRWSMATGLTVAALLILGLYREIPWARHTEFHSRTTYTTTAGQRANLELTDGTHIVLAPATRLEIPEDFASRSRTVRLSGEAFFDVAHTAGMPFVVEAGKVRTVVLGTAFGVRAYHQTVQLAVRSGRVAVNGTVLSAHDIARVTSNTAVTVLHDQSLDAVLGFAAGRLVLTDVPLQDAIENLDRWCDVDVQLGDPALARLTVNAILTDGSLGELIEMFQVTYGLHVVHVGRTITLYPR